MFGGKLSLVELVSSAGSFKNVFDISGIPRAYSGPPKVESHCQIRHENPGSYKSGRCKQQNLWDNLHCFFTNEKQILNN